MLTDFTVTHGLYAARAFDLREDPEERHDLFEERDPDHREILNELLEYKQKLVEACRAWSSRADTQVPEEERLRSLQALGYAR